MNLFIWQTIYVLSGAAILPFAPFLYLQGQYVRRRIGVLPDAGGEKRGVHGADDAPVKLLVIGESTVAGLGARTHKTALAGQFARHLSERIGRSVEWFAIGKNGVTATRTIMELVPQMPDEKFDYVLLGVGGNDVLKLSSPLKWRRSMLKLIDIMREKNPNVTIFITNAPAIRLSPILPQPIKFILGHLSALHDKNTKEFTARMPRVFYFHQPTEVPADFFADGIHPSEKGYEVWSKAMVDFCVEKYGLQETL